MDEFERKYKALHDAINNEDLKNLEKLLKDASANLINHYDKGFSLLSYAFQHKMTKKRFDIVKLLLKSGANPNGKTASQGNTMITPVSYIKSLDYFNEIIDTLLLYGFDINYYGTLFTTTLNMLSLEAINKKFNEDYYNALEYLLSKGANPNVKINPILNFFVNILILKKKYEKESFKFIDLFLYYNASPYLTNADGQTLLDIINNSDMPQNFKDELKSKLFISYDDILKYCNQPFIIKKLANAFKIPFKNKDLENPEKLKQICECIRTIKENFSIIEFDNIIELRKEINQLECENDSNFIGVDINEYPKEYIYTLKTGNVNYCFHKNDLVELLSLKKNPYTNKELEESEIKDILKNLKYIPNTDNSLEESVEIFNQKSFQDFTLNDLIEILTRQIDIIDSYLSYTDLRNLNSYLIKYLSDRVKIKIPNLKFYIDDKLNVQSEEYLHLKIYNLLYEITQHLGPSSIQVDQLFLSTFNLTDDIRKTLSIYECKKDIINFLEEKDLDVNNSENKQLFKRTLLKSLKDKDFVFIDGVKRKFEEAWINEILNIIERVGGIKLEVFTPEDAERVWNNFIGYSLDKY